MTQVDQVPGDEHIVTVESEGGEGRPAVRLE